MTNTCFVSIQPMTDPFKIDSPTCISFSGGRTSEACRADRALNAEMKRLWNAQPPNVQ